MPPIRRDKGKAAYNPINPQRRSREERSKSPESAVKKARREHKPEEPTLKRALPLISDQYFLADRLKKVSKLPDDESFHSRFEQHEFKTLGQGSFGIVSQFRDRKTGKIYAVKIVDKLLCVEKFFLYVEAACFTRILPDHSNIIQMAHICESPQNIYYVMECLSKFDLSDTFRAFRCAQARTCFYRILQAVDHLHQHGIIHGDIKLDNVCMREGDKTNPILIDFGLCSYNQSIVRKKRRSFIDTEVFTPREIDRMLSKTALKDLLKLADLLEVLLTGQPWLIDKKSPTGEHYPLKPDTDPEALALLEFMRNPDKLKISTCEQLLQHGWFGPERMSDWSPESPEDV